MPDPLIAAILGACVLALLIVAAVWPWREQLRHERLRKDMDDGASSDQAHPDAEPFAVSLANPDADQCTAP
jgi:hypothetical protein